MSGIEFEAYISIGSNIGNRAANIHNALARLQVLILTGQNSLTIFEFIVLAASLVDIIYTHGRP